MKANWILFPALLLQGMLITSTSGNKYINTPCETHTDCGLNNHLQCIENVCQCDSNSQIYDRSTEKCLLLVGQQCQIHAQDYQYNRQHSIPIKCVPNSDCTNSVCRCRPGYRFSPDFLCKPDFGSPCYASEDCDDSLGLICSYRGICDCYNVTLTYQGQFGCVDPKDPTFNEMLRLLNQTDHLLRENNLELKDMFNDLGLQNDLNESGEEDDESAEFRNVIAEERQAHDTYNTNDLQFAAQNQAPQMSGGGFNFQQLLSLFQTFRSLIPRNNGGGGGGFFRNLFGGGNNNNQGGYADSSSPPPPANTYGPPGGQPEMGQRMGLLNSFINLFNQMIPIVRQLRMRFMPLRFFRNLLNRFAPTTAAPPTAQSIANPPPSVIESNGNYQQNPIFGNNNGQQQSGPAAGTFRFFMRTRDRFRNFLRGNNNQGGQGGYSYPPGTSYGAPGETPPPADGAQPTSGGEAPAVGGNDDAGAGPAPGPDDDTPPPPAPAPASSAQHNTYLNNHRPPSTTPHRSHNNNNNQNNNNQFHGQQSQAQYNTINVGGHQAVPPPHPTQRQQQTGGGSLPRPATYNSGNRPNHESFYDGRQQSQQQQQTTTAGFNNKHANNHHSNQNQHSINSNQHNNNNNINAQATSHHHQSTFVAHHQQSGNQPRHPQPPQQQNNLNHNNNGNFQSSSSNIKARPPFPSIGSATPPPIPQFKLQIPNSARIPSSSTAESSLSENFILSEADDPHPGFTPLSTLAPPPPPHQESYRTSARFERFGGEEQQLHATRIAQNWRETF